MKPRTAKSMELMNLCFSVDTWNLFVEQIYKNLNTGGLLEEDDWISFSVQKAAHGRSLR